MTINNSSNPEIYVADLAAYNAGKLRGEWIDANQDADDIQVEIDEMLSNSPQLVAEDWAIHDYEQFYGAGSYLGEHPSLEDVATAAELISEKGELAGLVIAHFCGDLNEAKNVLEDSYSGEYDSLADYAEELSEESVGNIPDNIARYIDYEGMGRDMELGGDVFTLTTNDGKVHIFWNH
ncbi:MAG: antirestriction protein ArdA [Cyanobacteria bacterium P01_G01_bin.19]